MKKRFLPIALVIALICLSFNGLNTVSHPFSPRLSESLNFYSYNIKTSSITKHTQTQLCIRNNPFRQDFYSKNSNEISRIYEYAPNNDNYAKSIYDLEINNSEKIKKVTYASTHPYKSIVYISYKRNNKTYRASGFVIGPAAIITSAHALYNDGVYAEDITVTPAKANLREPYGTAKCKNIVINSNWINENDYNYDWAIIELNYNIGLSVGWLGIESKADSYNNTPFYAIGYPKSVDSETEFTMYKICGTISDSKKHTLTSSDATGSGGMSGGPVYYYNQKTGYTAFGIISGSMNKESTFIRFTPELFNLISSYRFYSV